MKASDSGSVLLAADPHAEHLISVVEEDVRRFSESPQWLHWNLKVGKSFLLDGFERTGPISEEGVLQVLESKVLTWVYPGELDDFTLW